MKYDKNLVNGLGNKLVELWNDCKIRCERIENLIKQINPKKSK